MLEIRPTCEHCDKSLPFNSKEARICTFECTFCQDCVENVLKNVEPSDKFAKEEIAEVHLKNDQCAQKHY